MLYSVSTSKTSLSCLDQQEFFHLHSRICSLGGPFALERRWKLSDKTGHYPFSTSRYYLLVTVQKQIY